MKKVLVGLMVVSILVGLAEPASARKKVPTWQKGLAIGVGVGATIATIAIARRDAKAERQESASQEARASQELSQLESICGDNFPLRGKTVVVTQIPTSRTMYVRYSRQETAQAIEIVRDALMFCGADVVDDPGTIQQIQVILGGRNIGRERGNIELPPYVVSVGAERVSRGSVGSRLEVGPYGRARKQSEWTGRVRIVVREKRTESFTSQLTTIGVQTGFGRETIGRSLSQRVFGGMYSNQQSSTSTPYFAVLHGTVAALANIRWSRSVQAELASAQSEDADFGQPPVLRRRN
ncbi:MAG: hypothetical protein Q7S09_04935 [bacterium]|nr:hypothetical protein [bacterium]